MALFPGPPRWAGARRETSGLWCKGRLTEVDTSTIRLGATPSGLTSAYLHHPPIFFTGRMPFLPPNKQQQFADRSRHTATGTHVPYDITQCYLPPSRGDISAFIPAEAGTRFNDPGGMQGWVDLVGWWYTRPKSVTHPSTNRVQRRVTSFMRRTMLTTMPRRHDR